MQAKIKIAPKAIAQSELNLKHSLLHAFSVHTKIFKSVFFKLFGKKHSLFPELLGPH